MQGPASTGPNAKSCRSSKETLSSDEGGTSANTVFLIVGEPQAALLSRLIGFLAQLGLGAPELTVKREGDEMFVCLGSEELSGRMAEVLAKKMASLVGVRQVELTVQEAMAITYASLHENPLQKNAAV